jgi:hypothetical protein
MFQSGFIDPKSDPIEKRRVCMSYVPPLKNSQNLLAYSGLENHSGIKRFGSAMLPKHETLISVFEQQDGYSSEHTLVNVGLSIWPNQKIET